MLQRHVGVVLVRKPAPTLCRVFRVSVETGWLNFDTRLAVLHIVHQLLANAIMQSLLFELHSWYRLLHLEILPKLCEHLEANHPSIYPMIPELISPASIAPWYGIYPVRRKFVSVAFEFCSQ